MSLLALLPASLYAASGAESGGREDDLVVNVDSRWAGGAYGGYWPIRIRLANLGKPRTVELRFQGNDSGGEKVPLVKRIVPLEANASVRVSLSVPLVSAGTGGTIRVYSDGTELETLRFNQHLPEYDTSYARTSLVVFATSKVDTTNYEMAANTLAYQRGSSGGWGIRVREEDTQVLPLDAVPDTWLDYTAVDMVAITKEDLVKLPAEKREAIGKWVACGGNLIVHQTGSTSESLTPMEQALGLPAETGAWLDQVPAAENAPVKVITEAELRMLSSGGHHVSSAVIPVPSTGTPQYTWATKPKSLWIRRSQLGQILAISEDAFPATAPDWIHVQRMLGSESATQFTNRWGFTSRGASSEFLNFLIPNVGNVPVYAFLILITMFAVLIGPVNYLWLSRRRLQLLLVITIPIFAISVSVMMLVYSLFSDGFSTRMRIDSVTHLNQRTNQAVAMSRATIYAPFAPSKGLEFSPECAVFPLWRTDSAFENGQVDWTGNSQRLTGSFLRSQTWSQVHTLEPRVERGHIDLPVKSDASTGKLKVTNGLEWNLKYLVTLTEEGEYFHGKDIPAGAAADLVKISSAEVRTSFTQLSGAADWAVPAGVDPNSTNSMFGNWNNRYRYMYHGATRNNPTLSAGLLKRNLLRGANFESSTGGPYGFHKRSYLAVLKENPKVNVGIKGSENSKSLHVLFGEY